MKREGPFSRLLFTQKGNRILALLLWGIPLLALFCLRAFSIPLTQGLWECPIRRATGLDCAGCGATRALESLMRLEFIEAFRYNPAFCIALVAFLFWLLMFTKNAFSKNYREPFSHIPPKWVIITICALLVAFMVIRNLPFYQLWFYK